MLYSNKNYIISVEMCIKYVLKKERLESKMKKYIKAKELLETKANKKEKKPIYATRKLSIGLVSCMLGLVMATPVVRAEEAELIKIQPAVEASKPVDGVLGDLETNDTPVPLKNDEAPQEGLDGLETQDAGKIEIGPEIVGEPVRGTLPAPTINKVFYDSTTISGGNVQRKRINKETVRSTVYVTLKDSNGSVKATVDVTPSSGTTWTVNLPGGVTVAAGDTVTAYQTLDGDTSEVVTENAEPSKAKTVTLKMPEGEIWIEQTSSNQVNKDEQAEAVKMLKDANTAIAGDIKSVKFTIDGTDHAYYEVTYTDGSTSGKIEATGLKIKTVTETSATPTIEKVQVTDGQIIVTLDKEVAPGTKFYFVSNFTDREDETFCQDGKCIVDKSTSKDMSQAVSIDGKKVTFKINAAEDLELGRKFGIVVKEPHKFKSCAKSEPVIAIPDKVDVRDPHKLTDADKKAIDKAIRDANTVNGKSKLPDWEAWGIPAYIEFDKDGNARIIHPSSVEEGDTPEGGWGPLKNEDGTYKVKDEFKDKVISIPAKDLVKNLAPKQPEIAVDTDTGKVTITPPAYKDPGDDTDLASYKITYKDALGADKTVTATRTVDATTGNTSWTSDGAKVDESTGVITLSVDDIEVGGTVTAIAKDKGGLEGDTEELESDEASKTLETATVSYNPMGGTGKMDSKKLNKGSKYTILPNSFTAPENQEFDTWEVDGNKVAAGKEITIKKDTEIVANWKKKAPSVTYDPDGGNWDGDTANKVEAHDLDSTIKIKSAPVKEGYDFVGWKLGSETYQPGNDYTVKNAVTFVAEWKKKTLSVTYNPDGGNWDGDTANKVEAHDLDSTIKIKSAPVKEGYDFVGWKLGSETYQPGNDYTVKSAVTFVAEWKKKENPNPNPNPNPGEPGGDGNTEQPGIPGGPSNPSNPTDPKDPGTNNPGGDNPADPTKPADSKDPNSPQDKPENKDPKGPGEEKPKEPGKDNPKGNDKKEPGKSPTPDKPNKTGQPSEGDKTVDKNGKKVVVPKEAIPKENGKIKVEDRPKIVDKFKEKNPDVVDVKIHDNGNVSLVFKDGTKAELSSKDLLRERGIKIPKKHSEDSLSKKAGKNVKTGIGSAAGIVCTLVASTGALYIGRKKED